MNGEDTQLVQRLAKREQNQERELALTQLHPMVETTVRETHQSLLIAIQMLVLIQYMGNGANGEIIRLVVQAVEPEQNQDQELVLILHQNMVETIVRVHL